MPESDPDGVPGNIRFDATVDGLEQITNHEQQASQSRAAGENLGAQIALLFIHAKSVNDKLTTLHLRIMEMNQQIEALTDKLKEPETKERLREKFQTWGKA